MMNHLAKACLYAMLFLGGLLVAESHAIDLTPFKEVKSSHFLVRYLLDEQRSEARQILTKAEQLYVKISRNIGYTKYGNYWTWEERAGIIFFPDQFSYQTFTGQPHWSLGYASRASRFFQEKSIVSYSGQPKFFDEILPHELTHLILWDFFKNGLHNIPVWFEEGIAQLEESGKRAVVQKNLSSLVRNKQYIPFYSLNKLHPKDIVDDTQVSVFYAQSLSIVLFLVEKYGQDSFYRLSKELRSGREFEEALRLSYGGIIESMAELETRWVAYFSC